MLRDLNLAHLSRQHHDALVLCVPVERNLKSAADQESVLRQVERILSHFDRELVNHFQLEERYLFPACFECGCAPDELSRLTAEHRKFESLAASLRVGPSEQGVRELWNPCADTSGTRKMCCSPEAQAKLPQPRLEQLGKMFFERAVRGFL